MTMQGSGGAPKQTPVWRESERKRETGVRLPLLRRVDQLVLDRVKGRLRAGPQPELAQDIGDVRPGRSFRDEQRGADLLVAHPLAQQPEHVLLAVGQRFDELLVRALLAAHPLR